jgi:hypothetical protein
MAAKPAAVLFAFLDRQTLTPAETVALLVRPDDRVKGLRCEPLG